jgi:hypothetical protein
VAEETIEVAGETITLSGEVEAVKGDSVNVPVVTTVQGD